VTGVVSGRFCGLLVAVVGLLVLGGASSARANDICANAVQRAENRSGGLPDCRAYEMVSSPYKEGFGADPRSFAEDGIVSYTSTGSFAGNAGSSVGSLYHATRSATGWVTAALTPPGAIFENFGEPAVGESADLRSSLWVMRRRDPPEADSDIYLRNSSDGSITRDFPLRGCKWRRRQRAAGVCRDGQRRPAASGERRQSRHPDPRGTLS
jgi:hypothetical protein